MTSEGNPSTLFFQEDWTSKQTKQINKHVSCMAWKANLIKSIAIESSMDIFCQFLGSLNHDKAQGHFVADNKLFKLLLSSIFYFAVRLPLMLWWG